MIKLDSSGFLGNEPHVCLSNTLFKCNLWENGEWEGNISNSDAALLSDLATTWVAAPKDDESLPMHQGKSYKTLVSSTRH